MITITIPGAPVTKKNSQRIVPRGKGYTLLPSAKYVQWETLSGYYLGPHKSRGIDYAVNVKGLFYTPTERLCDLVNLLEAACDMLVHYGVLKDDNRKIVVSHDGSRIYTDRDNPRTEIIITREDER